jgi:hypothetical protein
VEKDNKKPIKPKIENNNTFLFGIKNV